MAGSRGIVQLKCADILVLNHADELRKELHDMQIQGSVHVSHVFLHLVENPQFTPDVTQGSLRSPKRLVSMKSETFCCNALETTRLHLSWAPAASANLGRLSVIYAGPG